MEKIIEGILKGLAGFMGRLLVTTSAAPIKKTIRLQEAATADASHLFGPVYQGNSGFPAPNGTRGGDPIHPAGRRPTC